MWGCPDRRFVGVRNDVPRDIDESPRTGDHGFLA
jgi:hypothetical protein